LTTKARYDLFLNTPATGQIHAADCVIEEDNGFTIRVGFRYRDSYLDHPAAFPVDPRQLPLQPGETTLQCQGGIPAFLDDYLPDDWGRRVLSNLAFYRDKKRFNVKSAIDSLSLLGPSRIGAVVLVSHGSLPGFESGKPMESLAKAEHIAQLVDGGQLDEIELDEMSLIYLASAGSGVGGARPKALLYDENGHYLAKFNRLGQDRYNNARVELACLNMARAAGIEASVGRVEKGINGREVLLLSRFDIAPGGSRYHLISANGLLKDSLTQRDRGGAFRYDEVCGLLRLYSISIEADLQHLLLLMLFNRAINNTDDHERNFSLIHRGNGFQFAPAYDLVPTLSTGEYHAAGFGYRPNPPTPDEARSLGRVFGLSKRQVAEAAEQVSTAVSHWPDFAEEAGVSEAESTKIARYFTGHQR